MDLAARRRHRTVLLVVAAILLVAVVAFALSLASTAGLLPGQAEPTRIPITPFADLPGLAAPVRGTPVP